MTAPILESQASRDAMQRYAATSAPVEEIVADAVYLAELRGAEAALKAAGAMVDDLGHIIFPARRITDTAFRRDVMQELGRAGR